MPDKKKNSKTRTLIIVTPLNGYNPNNSGGPILDPNENVFDLLFESKTALNRIFVVFPPRI